MFGIESSNHLLPKLSQIRYGQRYCISWLLIIGFVTTILCAPFIPVVSGLGDEGSIIHGAERILHGSTLYLDFFEVAPPGAFAITAGWFSFAGISMLSARLLTILSIAGIACFTYVACCQVSKHKISSALI